FEDDRDDREPRRGPAKPSGSKGLIIGLALGALAMLLIVGVILAIMLMHRSDAPGPVAAPGNLQGVWESQDLREKITIDRDTIKTDFGPFGLEQRYKMIDDRTMEVDFHKMPPNQPRGGGFDHKVRWTIVSV